MRNWEPDPVRIPPRTFVAVGFVSACCFAVGVLLLWGRL
jgi:hypothetical protein